MKIINIFVKTIKTISRDWKYFVTLSLFPLILIIVAGGILSSININNIQVGIVVDSSMQNNFNEFNYRVYPDLKSCWAAIDSSSVGICVYSTKNEEGQKITVYHSGKVDVVEQYARSFILEKISMEQDKALLDTSKRIGTNLDLYKNLFLEVRTKLIDTKSQLVLEKQNIIERKNGIIQTREDYMNVYNPLKKSEPEFLALKTNIESNHVIMENDLNTIKGISVNINSYITSLRKAPLNNQQENDLKEIETYAKTVNEFIGLYESTYDYNKLKQILDNIESIYQKLDTIKEVLDRTIIDLDNTTDRMDKIILGIDSYLIELNQYVSNLDQFKNDSKYENIDWEVVSLSNSSNPILLSFPLLVAIIIMFTSVILSNMITSKQTHEKNYFREMIIPVKKINFLFSNYLVNLFFVAIQLIVLIFIGVVYIGIPTESIPLFVLGTFLTSSIFIFIGSTISYFIRQKSLSSLISIFVLIFSFVISTLIAPAILINKSLQQVMGLNPFVIFNNFLEIIFISNGNLSQVSNILIKMVIFFFIFGFILIYSRKRHDKKVAA